MIPTMFVMSTSTLMLHDNVVCWDYNPVFSDVISGRVIFTLYFMSDSYLGLDQQYDIPLEIIPASIEAQVNSEIKDSDLDGLIWDDDISQKEL